jgi:transcriptional antiterminator RfaH
MKHWFVALYRINEAKRAQYNLLRQGIDSYLPKIVTKKNKISLSEEVLFPGYIFIHSNFEELSSVNFTKGIKNVIKFGDKYSYISDDEIEHIRIIEKSSKLIPIIHKLEVGKEICIESGPLKGLIARICSLPSKERADVLLSFLGSPRRISIEVNDFSLI